VNRQEHDSLELFVDTLTITLGCVIFIALLLVTMTHSSAMDDGGLFHVERRSELLKQQIEDARASLGVAEAAVQQTLKENPGLRSRLSLETGIRESRIQSAVVGDRPEIADAKLDENRRLQLQLAKFPWVRESVLSNNASLGDRIARAYEANANKVLSVATLQERDRLNVKPEYVVLSMGRVFPVPGGPGARYEHVQWLPSSDRVSPNGQPIWELIAKPGKGLNIVEGITWLEQFLGEPDALHGRQVVLLIKEDSFEEGRKLLVLLSQHQVNFSWIPYMNATPMELTEGGLPPDAPL
jgi:hypothetical protein